MTTLLAKWIHALGKREQTQDRLGKGENYLFKFEFDIFRAREPTTNVQQAHLVAKLLLGTAKGKVGDADALNPPGEPNFR